MAEATNFKFGTHTDYKEYCQNAKLGGKSGMT